MNKFHSYTFIVLLLLFSACTPLKKLGRLPNELRESSGLCFADNKLYTINDSGNAPILYEISPKGKILHRDSLSIRNRDWEAVEKDVDNNIYIADIGNNYNARKDLVFYKIDAKDKHIEKIGFEYATQQVFPPLATEKYYDAEAFMVEEDSLTIFTKNRTEPFDGKVMVFRLPNQKGQHQAVLTDTINTHCSKLFTCWVTDAAWNEEKQEVYLLSSNKIFVVKRLPTGRFESQPSRVIKLKRITQKEAITFVNDKLLITDERFLIKGGKIYELIDD